MHEVGLMQRVLEIALKEAARQSACRIHQVRLSVGVLSGVVPEALEFAFSAVTAGTIAEGASLKIEPVEALCCCYRCGMEFEPSDWFYECPGCGNMSTDMRRGRELELTSLEVA
jgi:hydrogenase nickel incorporation protein HypA/HybF